MTRRRGQGSETKRRWLLFLLLVPHLAACSLLVDVPTPEPFAVHEGAPPALTAADLLRFSLENLGEVAPGFLYRSGQPSETLLEFLADRELGHVVTFRRHIRPEEEEISKKTGAKITRLPMSSNRPPTPRQVLELIRITSEAQVEERSVLIHCAAGADRTGVMIAIWRMLFQGVTDREALKRETTLFRHLSVVHPIVHQTIESFQPELFQPFVRNPALIDDEARVLELERHYDENPPLVSGRT